MIQVFIQAWILITLPTQYPKSLSLCQESFKLCFCFVFFPGLGFPHALLLSHWIWTSRFPVSLSKGRTVECCCALCAFYVRLSCISGCIDYQNLRIAPYVFSTSLKMGFSPNARLHQYLQQYANINLLTVVLRQHCMMSGMYFWTSNG